MTVENIPVGGGVTSAALEERRVQALEKQAIAVAGAAAALGSITDVGGPKSERFERVLRSCVEGRVATDVEGFLTFARELCDGMDREFPEG